MTEHTKTKDGPFGDGISGLLGGGISGGMLGVGISGGIDGGGTLPGGVEGGGSTSGGGRGTTSGPTGGGPNGGFGKSGPGSGPGRPSGGGSPVVNSNGASEGLTLGVLGISGGDGETERGLYFGPETISIGTPKELSANRRSRRDDCGDNFVVVGKMGNLTVVDLKENKGRIFKKLGAVNMIGLRENFMELKI
ncbi:hypothetical protein E1A91_A09G240100v1 [Gossypium mustelinum]|uniref:Uncharacterized protein n=1 Tax=Gossypium mustelinum TaxID=34275 RepID=A0A5D2Y1Q8_GOSMU|nr:hypothetical protein E1A91_A09G240100v1 [Gossypium mustelinum]TYJ20127.1 hypothetical protein E1A91_A09G240100v1 [Gossypium mustelinum]